MATSKPSSSAAVPASVAQAVLVNSTEPADGVPVRGYDFSQGLDFEKLLDSLKYTGFQATNIGLAIDQINRMRKWRLSDDPIKEDDVDEWRDPEFRKNHKAKIYLAYTSNMISSGVRETIRFLVQNKLVDVVVTSAGGIEEDFMKTMTHTYLGEFGLDDKKLRAQGINRLGNLLVPNSNYCRFEDWVTPILDKMYAEQLETKVPWTPSTVIRRLGLEINHPESVYYWCAKNDIPVFCPALTDGALGDMLYFHSFAHPGFIVDLVADIRKINDSAVYARKTGMIILGGGIVKHHTLNANLMRNGADYAVLINTGQEFDGSDSGARPEEAFSWGKIRLDARPVKISGDASYIFPLIVAMTFAQDFKTPTKAVEEAKKEEEKK